MLALAGTICICIISLALVVESGPSVNHSVTDAFLFKAIESGANSSFNIRMERVKASVVRYSVSINIEISLRERQR